MATNPTTANAPFSLNYDSLVESVQSYSQRLDSGFIAAIPEFIHLGQKKIAADFKTLWELRSVNATFTKNEFRLPLPARWRKMVSVSIAGATLLERTYEYVQLVGTSFLPAKPQYWSMWDYNNIAVSPIPDSAYPVNLLYYEQAIELSPEVQENLITREAPQLILAASLLEAAFWLKDQEKIAYWQQMYADAAQALKAEDASRIVDRNTSPLPAGG